MIHNEEYHKVEKELRELESVHPSKMLEKYISILSFLLKHVNVKTLRNDKSPKIRIFVSCVCKLVSQYHYDGRTWSWDVDEFNAVFIPTYRKEIIDSL